MSANINFLNKYRNTWSGPQPTDYYVNDGSAYHVLNQAGPSHIYHHPGYSTNTNTNTIASVETEITHHPASYQTVQYRINEDPAPVRLVRPITPANLKQNVRIRYLGWSFLSRHFFSFLYLSKYAC